MKTLNYRFIEELEVGGEYYFGQISNSEDLEVVESLCASFYDEESEAEFLIDFEIVKLDEESIFETIIKVTGISEL